MNKRITIQDIANSLGLSRNTVSKALNGTGILSETTKKQVLLKAAELGYKQYAPLSEIFETNDTQIKELALFTQNMPTSSHFASIMLDSFQEKISSKHYKLSIFLIRNNEINSCSLPNGFDAKNYHGIICVELFDLNYTKMLSDLNIPLLFVDSASRIDFSEFNADFILMENRFSVYKLTKSLINNNCKELAFAGYIDNCQSFYERYLGFNDAMKENNLSPTTRLFETKSAFSNTDSLVTCINSLNKIPDVFVCANDFVAIDMIKALRKCSFKIPCDILISGFDDSSESKIIEPHLTTISIPSYDIGIIAADMLLSRIKNPDLSYRTIYVNTSIKYRESTQINYG